MKISSADGAWFRMHPVGYEYRVEPPADTGGLDEWDDWLDIAVEVATADGRTWSFRDPCLTTTEAGEVAPWLRSCADHVSAELRFTEPVLAFAWLADRETVKTSFSHEGLPSWSPGTGLGRVFSPELAAPAADLGRAADQWTDEIATFPRRST